jgi:plastocyanin
MWSRVRTLSVLSLFGLVALATACGGGDDGGSGDSSALDGLPPVAESEYEDLTGQAEVVIEARDNKFEAKYVIVSPGTRITFDNKGRNPHNVVPVAKDQFETIAADELQPGDTAILQFDDAGDYPYYCSLHGTPTAGMDGRIRVADQ